MGNSISKNRTTILNCANWGMETFFNNFLAVAEEEGLKNNAIILDFLDQIDQKMQGRGFVMVELTDYFADQPDKLPLKLFYDLALKTIVKIKQQDFGEFKSGYFALLDDFSKKIL